MILMVLFSLGKEPSMTKRFRVQVNWGLRLRVLHYLRSRAENLHQKENQENPSEAGSLRKRNNPNQQRTRETNRKKINATNGGGIPKTVKSRRVRGNAENDAVFGLKCME